MAFGTGLQTDGQTLLRDAELGVIHLPQFKKYNLLIAIQENKLIVKNLY